jgi:hypothetical protein
MAVGERQMTLFSQKLAGSLGLQDKPERENSFCYVKIKRAKGTLKKRKKLAVKRNNSVRAMDSPAQILKN